MSCIRHTACFLFLQISSNNPEGFCAYLFGRSAPFFPTRRSRLTHTPGNRLYPETYKEEWDRGRPETRYGPTPPYRPAQPLCLDPVSLENRRLRRRRFRRLSLLGAGTSKGGRKRETSNIKRLADARAILNLKGADFASVGLPFFAGVSTSILIWDAHRWAGIAARSTASNVSILNRRYRCCCCCYRYWICRIAMFYKPFWFVS